MSGGFFGQTVLVELDAGQYEHIVFSPCAAAFARNHREIFFELILADGHVAQARKLADDTARVGQMVGDANAVEAEPPVKIHDFRHGQFSVRITRVDVKIAKQHLRRAVVANGFSRTNR